MFLEKISLINFKNYEQLEVNFSEKINCFTGLNGVGKTNLLDAIFYLSFCKSYFNQADTKNINYGQNFFVIQGDYQRKNERENIYCGVKRAKKKQFKRNKREYGKLSEHIGLLPIVMISPTDTALIIDGSEERRKFLDSVISQFDHAYLNTLIRYKRALQQRNSLLKFFAKQNSFDQSSLEIWNEQLIRLGTDIYKTRTHFIEQLIPIFQHYYQFISGDAEPVNLSYQSQLQQASYAQLLQQTLEKDSVLQYTSTGVHRDDLLLQIRDYSVKKNASQGQQKTFLIALKLAQFDFIKKNANMMPILLLDDIFDKLDAQRVQQIIELVSENNFGQIFITDTNPERVNKILDKIPISHKLFYVSDNELIIKNEKE